jgi:glycosyltransferase involved in cell wall biosynthesis
MATIGVFGLNMSPKSGGVYSLIDGLMSHARHSRHNFVYLTAHRPTAATLPANVEVVQRPGWARVATQVAMNLPRADLLFRCRALSVGALSAAAGVGPGTFRSVDGWLWPHCFKPVPNLRRTVVICHDMIHRHHPEYFSRRDRAGRRQAERLLPMTETILCPSRASAGDLLAAYPALESKVRLFHESPCEVVPEEECAAELRQVDETYGGAPLFLFVAVDWPHKNHRLLIDAAVALRGMTGRPFRTVFVGRRRGSAVAEAVAAAGAGDVVSELGGVSRAMLAALYRRATALVYPSLHEGFGIPLVEAMRYGVPIVASDRPCIPEVCGGAAALLPPDSPEVWAAEMNRLMTDAAHREFLAGLSRRRADAFSWAKTWQGVDDALDAALAGAPAGTPEAAPVAPFPSAQLTAA